MRDCPNNAGDKCTCEGVEHPLIIPAAIERSLLDRLQREASRRSQRHAELYGQVNVYVDSLTTTREIIVPQEPSRTGFFIDEAGFY